MTPLPPPDPIPDFPGFIASLLAKGYTINPCLDHCQDKGKEHEHLKAPDGHDGIVWADGHASEFDLTQPARPIYPTYAKRRPAERSFARSPRWVSPYAPQARTDDPA